MSEASGLERFGEGLHPDAVAEIEGWARHPELAKLHDALVAHTDETFFLDAYAEAQVARHLLNRQCALRFEVPTPSGRTCDFEVERDGRLLYLHLKRLHGPSHEPARLTISPQLRYLERIRRPYVVRVRWHEGLSDEQMERFVARAAEFISHARIGDELTVRDETEDDTEGGAEGPELGGVLVVAPWAGSHVSLAIGLPSGFSDQTPRIHKLLNRAYQQFMPKAMNVILMCSRDSADVGDYQTALLGSHVERWDAVPPRGRRIAHGRAEDGFWHGGRFAESVVAGWFDFAPSNPAVSFRLWQRRGVVIEAEMQALLGALFGD